MFQNALGQISSTSGIGFIDVTNLFKLNANAAFSYFQNALGIPNWSHQVAFKIGDLSAFGADGASLIKTYDLNGRTDASEITLDTRAVSRFYFDPTPANNSEWTMTPWTAVLAGGATVNVGRKGTAVAGGPADDRTDILTLMIHEIAHSLGMADGSDRFITAVGGVDPSPDTGLTDDNFRSMVMPTSLTGYLQTYVLPFRASSSHVSTLAAGQTFAKAVTSEPGSGHGARALLADVEIHALGLVNGSFGCCPFKGEGRDGGHDARVAGVALVIRCQYSGNAHPTPALPLKGGGGQTGPSAMTAQSPKPTDPALRRLDSAQARHRCQAGFAGLQRPV